jgi:hypothetical protein
MTTASARLCLWRVPQAVSNLDFDDMTINCYQIVPTTTDLAKSNSSFDQRTVRYRFHCVWHRPRTTSSDAIRPFLVSCDAIDRFIVVN